MTDTPKTLSDKIWDRHVVRSAPGEPDLLYIDLHLVHEVTSPQAFDGLRIQGRARASYRSDDRDRRSQRADDQYQSADRRSRFRRSRSRC